MYEIFCVVPGNLTPDDAERKIAEIKDKVASAGGTVSDSIALGKQKLAYPVRHERFGYFYALYVAMEAAALATLRREMERQMGLSRVFIRLFNPAKNKKARAEDMALTRAFMTDSAAAVAPVRRERVVEAAPFVMPFEEVKTVPAEPLVQKEPARVSAVSAEEIDRKLDELLESDLLPGEGI
ncbi:MAG: 30S ribosomal protein S6 [Patescibacteria group bacterium]